MSWRRGRGVVQQQQGMAEGTQFKRRTNCANQSAELTRRYMQAIGVTEDA